MKQYKLLKPYMIECRFQIFAGFISLLIVDILQLVIPRIIKWSIDATTVTSTYQNGVLVSNEAVLLKYAFYIVASAVLITVFRFYWRYLIMGSARRAEEGIREQFFNHIQTLPTSFFDKNSAGDIMAHATNDITNIRMALGMGLVGLTDTFVLGSTAICFMAYINLELTLLSLLPMPFIAIFTKIFSKKLFNAYMDVQAGFSDLMEATRERFAGIKTIKAFNREALELSAMKKKSEIFVKQNMDLVRLRGFIFPLVIFLTQVSLAIILGIGGRKVILKQISPGDFVAFISYLGLLTWPVMAVGWVTNMIQRGAASINRINAILEIPSQIDINAPDSIKNNSTNIAYNYTDDDFKGEIDRVNNYQSIKGKIEFCGVSFSYNRESKVNILNNINFRLKHGKMLGIAGTPGSGKSTLLSLIPRIYNLSKDNLKIDQSIKDRAVMKIIKDIGVIKIDGVNIDSIPIQRLRKFISFMPQEPFLFSGTIKDNLLFGNTNANYKEIAKALEMAQLTETIESLPNGIDTVIGEKGVMLSGGQKQRIALARALLKSSPILILDDPISQLDMETASNIIEVIESFIGVPSVNDIFQKTILIASHRFSIFKKADHIIVLDKGEIIERGTHLELIEQNGYYKRAWLMQESDDDLREVNKI